MDWETHGVVGSGALMTVLQDGVPGGQAYPEFLHRACYPSIKSLPNSSLAEYYGVNNLPECGQGLFPPSLWAGPSLIPCLLLSCTPIPVLMF